VMNC